MNISRREFLKNSGFTVAGTALFSKSLLALQSEKKKTITGVQLYSVRDDMKNDPAGTLKKLADMGYKYVEHANYVDRKFYGRTATEFKKLLDDLAWKVTRGQ